MSQEQSAGFKLPDRLITTVDLTRVARELRLLDDWLNQAAIRAGGTEVKAPKTSATLDEIATSNGVSLLDKTQREQLIVVLDTFVKNAPKLHMSFPVEPSPNFLSKMIVWLRANINPIILIDVGLQPALAAGCSVRTANKYFDMSLRNRFIDSRSFLIKAIEEFAKETPAETIPASPPVAEAPAQTPPAQVASVPVPVSPNTQTDQTTVKQEVPAS